MKEKQWTFFRVMVYLGFVAAALGLSVLFYFTFMRYGSLHIVNSGSVIIVTGFLCQMVFNILNMRLIHHYLFNKILPGTTFSSYHTILLVINSCIAVAMLCVFLYGCIDTFTTKPSHSGPKMEDVIALCVTGTYTFITVYTITGSLIMKRYIRYATSVEEEEWLNRMGA